ncbi:MAG: NAD(P)-dependent oxidoreductase [Candidatus Gastranaerophilales bacterium]|nr:NAD(P)-dependent oxidoreductase [Candidatus Gastranaerophilales bacterium]
MKKKILLTGGNGFIGKNIKESYLSQNYEIIAPSSKELNLLDTDCSDDFFKDKNFDVILHAACKPGHRNAKDRSNLYYSNVKMFLNLERNKNHYKKLINFGSGAIYDGSDDISNAVEDSIYKKMPDDEHGFCKYTVRKMIDNLDGFVDLNIFGIFGKYEDYAIRFISNAIAKTVFNYPITLRQDRLFSYLYIDDLMPILEFFIENETKYKSYNIVPDEKTSLLNIANKISKLRNNNLGIKVAKAGTGIEYTGSNNRLKQEFKQIKFTKIDEAIKQLYTYYQEEKNNLNENLLKSDK